VIPSPQPVIFDPIFRPKPWGGRKLETFFGKRLPPGELIGESWELASLPGAESRVRSGPLAGRTLAELVESWGSRLYGDAQLVDGRFPLLIKFLDARERLSVQVHARPAANQPAALSPGVKHEAWYIVDAEPGAELFIGVQPGTSAPDLARAAQTGQISPLLRSWPARRGAAFFLPSGVIHALGAGLLVAEIQTPADVTYRLCDWDRVDASGRRRQLHIEQALENALLEAGGAEIQVTGGRLSDADAEAVVSCDRFCVECGSVPASADLFIRLERMVIWVVLSGRGSIGVGHGLTAFAGGDVVLIPPQQKVRVTTVERCGLLRVTVP
jgi:mannose-6-phosphate isomerase